MKKFFAGLFIAVLCIALIVLAYAKEESAPCYTPVLMDWDAKDGKDLEQKILEYWRTNAPGWEAGLYTPQKRSMTFRLGGTTEELIKDYRNWDIAIVSSKEVDLQKLADEGVVISCAYNPSLGLSLHHSLLPKAVRKNCPSTLSMIIWLTAMITTRKPTRRSFWFVTKRDDPQVLGRAG